jgi:flavin-binding protein dodecin
MPAGSNREPQSRHRDAAGLKAQTTGRPMSTTVAKVIEISSTSTEGFQDAIRQGIARACKTVQDVRGAWIKEQKVVVSGGDITEYRVDMKVTFVMKD